ncbi:hypothetical protein ZIOFF_007134 [Zingiber officinale]|uniref:Uncharacterized protein n=1 Tax=Zingiber officinale TaxID=94328 RepID=A0A8J5HPI9_ZINOF|nr:hypothetical protein ZIOFF_007134 [Zingiber officinale]
MAPVGGCSQRVFAFGKGRSEGDKSMKNLVRTWRRCPGSGCRCCQDSQCRWRSAGSKKRTSRRVRSISREILEALGKVEEEHVSAILQGHSSSPFALTLRRERDQMDSTTILFDICNTCVSVDVGDDGHGAQLGTQRQGSGWVSDEEREENLWRLAEQVQKQSPYAASATKGGEDDDNHVSELVPGEIFELDAEDKQAL